MVEWEKSIQGADKIIKRQSNQLYRLLLPDGKNQEGLSGS